MKDIPGFAEFKNIAPISKGMSDDKKFHVETAAGGRLLLRLSDIKEFKRKEAEYETMGKARALGVLVPAPRAFGVCCGGKKVYSLSGWLDGVDVEAALPEIEAGGRYLTGVKAGELLRKIHTLPAPEDAGPWYERFLEKIKTRLDLYERHGLRCEGGERVIEFLHDRRELLFNRPQTLWHGDFSAGNLILTPGGEVGAIDFNFWHFGHGDPWWEFIATPWGEEPEKNYQTGLINGYFKNEPPCRFFELLAYYYATDALSALCYSFLGLEPCKPEDGRRHLANVLRWFGEMEKNIPEWYLG